MEHLTQYFPTARYITIGKWRFIFRDGVYNGWYRWK